MRFTYTKEKTKDVKEQLGLGGSQNPSLTIYDQNKGVDMGFWIGNQEEFSSLDVLDSNILYILAEDIDGARVVSGYSSL